MICLKSKRTLDIINTIYQMKFINLIFLLFFITLQNEVTAQNNCNFIKYKKSCNKSYVDALKNSEYQKAIKGLEKVQKKYGFLSGEEFMLKAYAYKKLGNSLKCAENVKLAWSNYSVDWNYLFEISELLPNIIGENFNDDEKLLVNEGYKNFAKLRKSPFADSILNIIRHMDSTDAAIRNKYEENKSENNRIEIVRIDSLNGLKFKKIVDTYGFPGETFSPGNSSACFRLILHFADYPTCFKQMNSKFIKEVKKGRMAPSLYLYWLDRHLFSSSKKSKYGMYLAPNANDNSKLKVNRKRLKYGVNYGFPIPPKAIKF